MRGLHSKLEMYRSVYDHNMQRCASDLSLNHINAVKDAVLNLCVYITQVHYDISMCMYYIYTMISTSMLTWMMFLITNLAMEIDIVHMHGQMVNDKRLRYVCMLGLTFALRCRRYSSG